MVGESPDSSSKRPRFYAASSFWNAPVAANAPLDPESAELTNAFVELVASEEAAKAGPAIATTEWSVPVYTVPANQPLERVTLETKTAPALQAAWEAVPIPPDAVPARGTDGTLVIWQPSTEKLWEFWRAVHRADGWHASWGGATQNVSQASGIPDAASWPGAKPWWGASAASVGVAGGLISIEELEDGWIDHALQISIPNARANVFASPALRTDGRSTAPDSLPEGAHLRLDPSLDLSTLHLPRTTRLIAQAAQRFGIIINNSAHSVSFQAEDPTQTGTDPYHGPSGFFEGKSARVLLSSFPWKHLQVLKMELHGE